MTDERTAGNITSQVGARLGLGPTRGVGRGATAVLADQHIQPPLPRWRPNVLFWTVLPGPKPAIRPAGPVLDVDRQYRPPASAGGGGELLVLPLQQTDRMRVLASLPRLLGVAVCSVLALGTGNNVIVMFAIALAGASLLTTVGMIVPMDPPVGRLIMETDGTSGLVNRLLRPDSVRHMSVTTAMQGLTTADTQRDNSKTAREPGYAQATGRLRRWWQVLGSKQRRLSRRFQ